MLVELIHNPASGTFDEFRLDVLSRAFQACGARVRLGRTEHDGRFEIFPESDLICISGGDGALRLVVASMARAGLAKPLCVYPAGTVNLVARELGYSSDPERFAREVMAGFLAGKSARLAAPTVTSDGQPFVACISVGPDGGATQPGAEKTDRRRRLCLGDGSAAGGLAAAAFFADSGRG